MVCHPRRMWWLGLACTGGEETALRGPAPADEPTLFAVGEGWRGDVMGANPFLGSLHEGAWTASVRDLSSPTAATEHSQAFSMRTGLGAISNLRGNHTLDVGDLRKATGAPGETLLDLVGDPSEEQDPTLVWSTDLAVEHLVGTVAPNDVVQPKSRGPLLEKAYTLETQSVECDGERRRFEATIGEPVAGAEVAGHVIVQWPVTLTRQGQRPIPGSALFLESGGPIRSSATAPYLKLCGNDRPISVDPELYFRVEDGPPMLLASVQCSCSDRRFAIVDLDLGEAVIWSW